jgi:hypothetical protein
MLDEQNDNGPTDAAASRTLQGTLEPTADPQASPPSARRVGTAQLLKPPARNRQVPAPEPRL